MTENTDTTTEVVEAELVETPAQPATLFRTDDPVEVLTRATTVAEALAKVIQKRQLYQRIGNKNHVLVEGWLTLGSMLGVTPVCTWTRPMDQGWEARVEARTLDGRVIGAAEAECLREENRWKKADDYAIRSMAQTRATSKALGSVLRFVVTLAGFSGTPAEEMPADGLPGNPAPPTSPNGNGPTIGVGKASELVKRIRQVGLGFDRIQVMFGSVGANSPKINREDSVRKALSALTEAQAAHFDGLLQTAAGVEGD